MNRKVIMVGIVGDSASGKTTLTRGIVDLLGRENVTAICSDDYHKYNRAQRKQLGITALHPDCNYIDIMEQHFVLLRQGQPILKPVYNHSTGDFDPPEYVKPSKFVIVEGLLGFHTRIMRNCFDLKVYLDPPEPLRHEWKIKRDTSKRGYTREQVLEALRKRQPDTEKYIWPQRALADVVVQFYPPNGKLDETGSHLNARLVLRPTVPHPDFTVLLDHARQNGHRPALRMELGRHEGKPADILEVDGDIGPTKTRELEDVLWQHLIPRPQHTLPKNLIGIYSDGLQKKQSYPLALTQLLIAYHMMQAAETLATEGK